MNLKQICSNCHRKGKILTVYSFENYKVTSNGFWTRSEKTCFRICRKCGNHSDFLNGRIASGGIYRAYFVSREHERAIRGLVTSLPRKCIFCESSIDPPRPQAGERTDAAIILLHFKNPKKFLGYFCSVCKIAYYLKLRTVDWEKSSLFRKMEKIDLLNHLTSKLPKDEREIHPRYDHRTKTISWIQYLDQIGMFTTTKGADMDIPEYIHSIHIPKPKYSKVMKFLTMNGVRIIR